MSFILCQYAECHHALCPMLSVTMLCVLRWVSLCCMSYAVCRLAVRFVLSVTMLYVLCWVLLCWISLCWVSQCCVPYGECHNVEYHFADCHWSTLNCSALCFSFSANISLNENLRYRRCLNQRLGGSTKKGTQFYRNALNWIGTSNLSYKHFLIVMFKKFLYT